MAIFKFRTSMPTICSNNNINLYCLTRCCVYRISLFTSIQCIIVCNSIVFNIMFNITIDYSTLYIYNEGIIILLISCWSFLIFMSTKYQRKTGTKLRLPTHGFPPWRKTARPRRGLGRPGPFVQEPMELSRKNKNLTFPKKTRCNQRKTWENSMVLLPRNFDIASHSKSKVKNTSWICWFPAGTRCWRFTTRTWSLFQAAWDSKKLGSLEWYCWWCRFFC